LWGNGRVAAVAVERGESGDQHGDAMDGLIGGVKIRQGDISTEKRKEKKYHCSQAAVLSFLATGAHVSSMLTRK
jgi:hypothetical protein